MTRRYFIDPRIFAEAPDFCRGVIIVRSADNRPQTDLPLERRLRDRIFEIEQDESITLNSPQITAWTRLYKNLGLSSIQPSLAALIKRIRRGKGREIPFISRLVCISNLASLSFLIPSGLVDADAVLGDFVLGLAQGDEHFDPIGGSESSSIPKGEIIYYDSVNRNVMCRGLNSRGGKPTRIRPETTDVAFDLDALLSVTSESEWRDAVFSTATLIEDHCSASTEVHFLNKENPAAQIQL